MTKFKTVIVDDEQDAVNFIQSIINEYIPALEVVGTANSAKEGVSAIIKNQPEVVFLDVEMPHGNGFTLLEQFPEKTFDVVFVTAFNHYAIQAIKFSAIDYILKPINIKSFIESVEKVIEKKMNTDYHAQNYDLLFENLKSTMPSKLASI